MYMIQSGRQTGKTTHMIALLKANPDSIMIVMDHKEKARLSRDYPEIASQLLGYNEREKLRGVQCNLLVDNLDIIFYELFGQVPRVVSLTNEDGSGAGYRTV